MHKEPPQGFPMRESTARERESVCFLVGFSGSGVVCARNQDRRADLALAGPEAFFFPFI